MAGMNVAIHTAMYGYYALKAMKFRVPSYVNILITTAQVVQMIVGTSMHIIIVIERSKGNDVHFDVTSSICGILLYGGFLILFSNFFVQSYIMPSCAGNGRQDANKRDATKNGAKTVIENDSKVNGIKDKKMK